MGSLQRSPAPTQFCSKLCSLLCGAITCVSIVIFTLLEDLVIFNWSTLSSGRNIKSLSTICSFFFATIFNTVRQAAGVGDISNTLTIADAVVDAVVECEILLARRDCSGRPVLPVFMTQFKFCLCRKTLARKVLL